MPMTSSGMSAAIATQLDAIWGSTPTSPEGISGATWRQEFCDALATAIVAYIQANADIDITAADWTVTTAMGPGIVNVGGIMPAAVL